MFLDFEKNVKNVKNVRRFTGRLITQPLITQLPEVSTGKSLSPTSNILLRSVDTRKYATETVCDKRLYVPITSWSFEAKISIDIQQTFFFFVTMLASLRTKFLLPTFYVFLSHFKKRKKSCFFEI